MRTPYSQLVPTNRPLTVLIHGFNNSDESAARSFQAFQNRLWDQTPWSRRHELDDVWEFHWPGDHPEPRLSRITFNARIGVAHEAGRLLADYLLALPGRPEVRVVAHSLGCRVALAMASRIRHRRASGVTQGAQVTEVILMAAAVSVDSCRPGHLFGEQLLDAREHAFHSRADRVLRRYFSPGQRAFDYSGVAVGLEGAPEGRWSTRFQSSLDHGEYWGSVLVAEQVAQRFGGARHSILETRSINHRPSSDGMRVLAKRLVSKMTVPTRDARRGPR